MELNLPALISEMILYTALHNEIGLKSSKVSGMYLFRIKAMKVELIVLKMFLALLDLSTATSISLPIKPKTKS